MRQRKRIVEEELNIERSATPSASPPAVATAPISNNIPPRRSALTSALQQQQQQQQQSSNGTTNGATGLPPLRKSVSDGSGTQSNSTLPQSITHSDDEERASLLVDGPGSYSPRLHSIPPVSTSYTASKPVPSLASFIIESHSSDQQGTKSSSAVNSPQPPPVDDTDATATGFGASSTIPIPKRKSSKASPQPIDLPAPVLDSTNSPLSSNPVTPIISSRSFTHSDGLLESSAILPNSVTSAATSSGSHLSRVNSWTHIAPSTSAQQLNAIAATATATDHLQLPTSAAKSSSNGSSNASSTTSTSSATNGSTYSHLSDSAAAHASMLRCERLLEVRSLFMSAYHHVLPSTPPAGNSPHSKATAYAAAMRALAAQRRESTVVIEKEDMPIQVATGTTTNSTTIPAAAPPTRASSQSVTAAPVAAPITRAASSSGWFSSN